MQSHVFEVTLHFKMQSHVFEVTLHFNINLGLKVSLDPSDELTRIFMLKKTPYQFWGVYKF